MYRFTPKNISERRRAFTLVEVLIVIGIIALLMGITTQMLSAVNSSQGRARARTDMALISSGIEAFRSQYGGYPRTSAAVNEKTAAADIYKCLVGKMIMRISDDQIMMSDVGTGRKPFIDAVKLRVTDPDDPMLVDVDPEKNGVYFGDPWGEPYLYFFDTTTSLTNDATATWRSPGYILMSKGPDQKAKDVNSMYSTGIIPDNEDYIQPEENIDNIIYGRDD